MIYILAIVGAGCLIVMAGITLMTMWEIYSWNKETEKYQKESCIKQEAYKKLGVTFQVDSFYFAEDKDAQTLIKLIGEHLDIYGCWDPEKIRDSWHEISKSH